MANTNQIIPFATAGGANVLQPSDYANLQARSSGFVNGVANPAWCNTVWRQASYVASMVAQFTADYNTLTGGAGNVNDDGNVANLETQFVNALQSFFPQNGLLHYGVATGTANAIVTTVTPNITSLSAGCTLLVKIAAQNTGATTITANGLATTTITRPDQNTLQLGDLEPGAVAVMIHDGTEFQLVGSMFLGNDLDHYGVDTGTVNTITVPTLDPPLLTLKPGSSIRVKNANTNTGSVTLNAGTTGAKTVKLPSGTSLVGGEIVAGSISTFTYDGTQYYLQTAQATNTSNSTGGLTAVATTSPIHGSGPSGDPVRIDAASTTGPGAIQVATATQYAGNNANSEALAPDQVWLAAAFIPLAYAPTITLDGATGFNWIIGASSLTSITGLTGAFTLANPVNMKSGQEGLIYLPQDANGSRTVAVGSAWITAGGFPGASTAPNAKDAIAYKCMVGGASPIIVYSYLKGLA